MNIDGISSNPFDSVRDVTEASRKGAGTGKRPAVELEQVKLSNISRMMSKGAQNLQSDLSPRPEKIDQFKGSIEDSLTLSDEAISTILKKMSDA